MKIGVTDIESNSLYNKKLEKFHCAWIIDPNDTKDRVGFKPSDLGNYIKALKGLDVVIGHNVVDYDAPALHLLSNNKLPSIRLFDTYVLSRMLYPERLSHSLKSWGYELGILKGEYGSSGEEGEDVWAEYNDDMYEYCEQDVEVTVALYHHLCKRAGFDPKNPPAVVVELTELEKDYPHGFRKLSNAT